MYIEIEKVVGPTAARLFERQVGHVAPAIGLTGQERDAFRRSRGAREGGKVLRQRGERERVDDPVSLVVPRVER
jgi:hypothetical protein